MIMISEAHAGMHLRQHVTQEDVDMAIRVYLNSFISTQKFGVQKALEKVSFSDLSGKLMAPEILLQNSGKPISVVANVAPNVARQHTSSNQSLQANNGYRNNGASSTRNKKWFPTPCQICRLNNHQAKWCRKRYNRDNITANATKVNVSSNDWFPDTVASHHMTPDLSALEISDEYKGWSL